MKICSRTDEENIAWFGSREGAAHAREDMVNHLSFRLIQTFPRYGDPVPPFFPTAADRHRRWLLACQVCSVAFWLAQSRVCGHNDRFIKPETQPMLLSKVNPCRDHIHE